MKDKLIINGIATILVIFFGIVAHVQYFQTKNNVIQLYSDKQSVLARQAAVTLESFIKERIKALNVIADNPASRQLQQDIFLAEYQRTYEKVNGFAYITFINTKGIAIAGFPENFPCPTQQLQEVRDRFMEAFEKARDEHTTIVFSRNVLSEGKVYVCLISPIYSFQNEFLGAILGSLDVKESVTVALEPIITDAKDYAWILNETGYLLYHPIQEEMLLKNVFENQATCLECHTKFSIEKQMLKTSSGAGVTFNTQVQKQLIGYAAIPLGNTKWIVAVSSPFTRVTAAIRNQFKNLLMMISLMIISVIVGAVFINRLNTKRISTQKELESLKIQTRLIREKDAAESRYKLLVEQSPDPIFLCDRKKFIMVNPSFEKVFGYSQDDVCSESFSIFQLVKQENNEKLRSKIRSFINDESESFSSIHLQMLSKSRKQLEVEISMGRYFIGNKLVYQGIVHDITKIKQLEREREQKKHLAIIGEMSARIAHEIKNPLASIQTGIQLLESQLSENDLQKGYYERLRGEIQRVDTILKGLLTYARGENLTIKSVSVEPLLSRFQDLVMPTIQKQNLNFKVQMDTNLPRLKIDEQKIEQVLWNIVLNAIQANKPGGTIFFYVTKDTDVVKLQVRDEGDGISDEVMKKIFVPFFSTRIHGSGLGLAISKKIIELHHGKLYIESSTTSGTTVTIELEIDQD